MSDDHVVTGGLEEWDPQGLAQAIVIRPGMYIGAPVTFDRVAACALGLEMAVLMRGDTSPLSEDDHRLLRDRPNGERGREQELEDVRRLEPVLARLLSAAQKRT